ncbi:MAG: type IV pilin protein [Pseudomonadota bacterium]|nr:type IV pilin protein [Pseudomonadota bacterium]
MSYLKQTGFTLIELMIVVAILAVITSIAIPAYNGYISSARNTEAHNNMAALRLAEEEYYLENNTYVAGEYDAGGTQTLSTGALGWSPSEPDAEQQFKYTVTAGSTSDIATSYQITAQGLGDKVPTSVTLTLE